MLSSTEKPLKQYLSSLVCSKVLFLGHYCSWSVPMVLVHPIHFRYHNYHLLVTSCYVCWSSCTLIMLYYREAWLQLLIDLIQVIYMSQVQPPQMQNIVFSRKHSSSPHRFVYVLNSCDWNLLAQLDASDRRFNLTSDHSWSKHISNIVFQAGYSVQLLISSFTPVQIVIPL